MNRPAVSLERHLRPKEAAHLIGLSEKTLRNMRVENRGPRWIVTRDHTIRYPESALAEYLGQDGEP